MPSVAHETDLETEVSIQGQDQGDETAGGKIDMAHALASRAEHFFRPELHLLGTADEPIPKRAWQRCEQLITPGDLRRVWHS